MTNPERDFYSQLSPEETRDYARIIASRHNLRMAGCSDCELHTVLEPTLTAGKPSSSAISVTFDHLCHYAIDLNSLKDPNGSRIESDDPPDRVYVAALFARLGLPDEAVESAFEVFASCVACPQPLAVTGEEVTFEEARAIFLAARDAHES